MNDTTIAAIVEIVKKLEHNELAGRFLIGDLIIAGLHGKARNMPRGQANKAMKRIAETVELAGGLARSIQWYYNCLRMARNITGKNRQNVLGNRAMTVSYAVYLGTVNEEYALELLSSIKKNSPTAFEIPRHRKGKVMSEIAGAHREDKGPSSETSISCPFEVDDVENVVGWIYSQARRGGFLTVAEIDSAINMARKRVVN